MGKRIVVATSTSCLDYYKHDHNIEIIRIKLDISGKLYSDGLDMTADNFYKFLEENPTVVPKTSQPPIGELLEFFEGLKEKGYDEVFVTTISSKFSGVFNGIYQCSKILEDSMTIVPFDTKTVCFNEGMFALKAAEMLENNKSFAEISECLEEMRKKNTIFFAVDTLDFLVKNGRLSGAAGFFGALLKIKPLLQVMEDGTIIAIEKIRTTKKALEAVCDKVNSYLANGKCDIHVVYTGTALRDYFLNLLAEKCNLNNIVCHPCTPIVGCHVGPNAIGVGIFME